MSGSLFVVITYGHLPQRVVTGFACMDHAAGALGIGMPMPPTTMLIYGNPAGGTPLMLAAPLAALDLPLRVLMRENDPGEVSMLFHPTALVLRQAGVPEALANPLDRSQHILVEVLS